MKSIAKYASTFVVAFAVILSGCQKSESEEQSDTGDTVVANESDEMNSSGPDTTGAAVWAYIQDADYQNTWTSWPDKGSLYTGQQPHGAPPDYIFETMWRQKL